VEDPRLDPAQEDRQLGSAQADRILSVAGVENRQLYPAEAEFEMPLVWGLALGPVLFWALDWMNDLEVALQLMWYLALPAWWGRQLSPPDEEPLSPSH
jgi:hypothetical protein